MTDYTIQTPSSAEAPSGVNRPTDVRDLLVRWLALFDFTPSTLRRSEVRRRSESHHRLTIELLSALPPSGDIQGVVEQTLRDEYDLAYQKRWGIVTETAKSVKNPKAYLALRTRMEAEDRRHFERSLPSRVEQVVEAIRDASRACSLLTAVSTPHQGWSALAGTGSAMTRQLPEAIPSLIRRRSARKA